MGIAALIIILILGLAYAYCIYDQWRDEKKKKLPITMEKIYQLWKSNTKLYSDKSTFWLIQMTADMAGIEYADVVKAIREGKNNDKN